MRTIIEPPEQGVTRHDIEHDMARPEGKECLTHGQLLRWHNQGESPSIRPNLMMSPVGQDQTT